MLNNDGGLKVGLADEKNVGTPEFKDDPTRLTALIDWLEFTVHDMSVDRIINLILKLDKDDFIELHKGRFGYRKQKIWNAGTLFLLYNI